MTADTVPAQAQSPETSAVDAGYQSLVALRDGHLALKQSISESEGPGAANTAASIRAYLAKAREAGAFIADTRERRSAQGILDYWSAELAGLPDATAEDFAPLLLLPADTERVATAPQGDRAESAATTANKETDRALIRLSAMARQWRDSGKQAGYLLSGETIEEAARFKDQDPNLAEFVEASQQVVERAKRFRKRLWSAIGVASVLLAAAGVTISYTEYLTKRYDRFLAQIQTSGTVNNVELVRTLRTLDFIQPLRAPYDLSGLPKLANINLPGLRLYAPNFAGVEFSHVGLPGASLPVATFSAASFSFDGGGDNDFSVAELRQAQFRNARIAFTSFAGADLYRAVFDRSILCDVNFSGANLRNASFWAVTLNDKTKEHLKNTAWWLAVGWPWSEIEKLAPPHQNTADRSKELKQESARVIRLKASSGFQEDIRRSRETIQRSSVGTLERALALNDLAWTDAVWGLDVTGSPEKSAADPCAADNIPATAHDAAEQAVCIVGKLNSEGDKKGSQTELLSSLRDTWAYVQMQSNEMPAAVKTFEEIARDDPNSLGAGETSFRYAIAQYAVGQDKAAAIQRFKYAIEEKRYQPTHELQTLRDYIFTVSEFVDVLKTSANTLWPPVANDTPCPVRKSAAAQ
jgi:Pentapeptide repeats (8 copies)